jgi:hypothetical protein
MLFFWQRIACAMLICFALGSTGRCQSLLVGIPSADVCPEKRFEWTHESQFGGWRTQDFKWHSFNFITYGIGPDTEVALSLLNLGYPPTGNLAVGLGYKKIFPLWKKHNINRFSPKWTVGQMGYFGGKGRDWGFWFYSHGSIKLPKWKTRLTAGLSYGSSHVFGHRTVAVRPDRTSPRVVMQDQENQPLCAMIGIEQPINDQWGLLADWYSGDHDLAALITAVQYKMGHHVLILGYKFDNTRYDPEDAIVFEMMLHF